MAVGHDELFYLFRNTAHFLDFLAEARAGGHAAADGAYAYQHFLYQRLLGGGGHGGLHLFLRHGGAGLVRAHDHADMRAQIVGSLQKFTVHFGALHVFRHECFRAGHAGGVGVERGHVHELHDVGLELHFGKGRVHLAHGYLLGDAAADLIFQFRKAAFHKAFQGAVVIGFQGGGMRAYVAQHEFRTQQPHLKVGHAAQAGKEQGLIHDLGLYVLEHVCRKLVDRKKKGLPPVGIHINVSTVQFSKNGFFASFMEIIDRYGIDPSQIVMEVTESIMIQSFDFIMAIMKRFIDRGVCFSLDDFGTGYSSLNYIAALPISSIKLDKSFIDRSEKSDVYALLIKNVVEIARGLKIELIVEGVETTGQVKTLTKIGCEAMQGYYFSKPLPETELDNFFYQDISRPAACETSAVS